MNVNSAQDDGWEEYGKKSKNRNRSNASKQWGPQHSSSKAWGNSDTVQNIGQRSHGGLGRGSGQTRPTLSSDSRKQPGRGYIKPQSSNRTPDPVYVAAPAVIPPPLKNGWGWSTRAASARVAQINEPERQWHCPACKGGPGAIDWYRGLQPLITHAKTKRSKRVKLHRELAELLDEELKRRGTSALQAGEVFGKWNGLEEIADKEIVWPPMVVVMNTRLERDENEKWIGMGNQELLDYFSAYSAVKARHSYGPQGHRGMSVLIFEASAVGYIEAERLSNHFEDNCRDRLAWERNRVPFYAGGKRQLYGYMAEKQDMDNFNQHSQALMVQEQSCQRADEQESSTRVFWHDDRKASKTMDENHIVKLRTKKHHEQNKEEMDSQEEFFRDQIQQFYDARNAKEENFEKLQQHEREKVTQSDENVSSVEERLRR
ncbi:hypothetical protein DH2020_036770 [Rehmannia glutinosa]|uniref:XS domain-containing protein n=1 Tax=Rehmannia glutinosa TaxID=99300 RepID=A0ABR0V623_REHGL